MAKHLSTFAIAEMLHVDPGSVANWIDQDLLRAHRTPGGHRRVLVEDLVRFLREHKMPVPPELNHGPVKVLVVDDEPAITQLIARALRAALPELEIVEANDGFRAGALVATLRPEVVILDLRMPGMDGFDICRLIKGQEDTAHAKVLAITAYPTEESQKNILECGAQACLTKPLEMADLVAKVKAAL